MRVSKAHSFGEEVGTLRGSPAFSLDEPCQEDITEWYSSTTDKEHS